MKTDGWEKVVDMEYHKAEIKKRDARIAALEGALTDIIWSWENEGASMIENVLANLEASRKVKHE